MPKEILPVRTRWISVTVGAVALPGCQSEEETDPNTIDPSPPAKYAVATAIRPQEFGCPNGSSRPRTAPGLGRDGQLVNYAENYVTALSHMIVSLNGSVAMLNMSAGLMTGTPAVETTPAAQATTYTIGANDCTLREDRLFTEPPP